MVPPSAAIGRATYGQTLWALVQAAARDVALAGIRAGQPDEPEVTREVGVKGTRPRNLALEVAWIQPDVVGTGEPFLPGRGHRAENPGFGVVDVSVGHGQVRSVGIDDRGAPGGVRDEPVCADGERGVIGHDA